MDELETKIKEALGSTGNLIPEIQD
jgi:hypothetical protein